MTGPQIADVLAKLAVIKDIVIATYVMVLILLLGFVATVGKR